LFHRFLGKGLKEKQINLFKRLVLMNNILITVITLLYFQFSIYYQFKLNSNGKSELKPNLVLNSLHSDNPIVSQQDILFLVKHNQSPNVVVYQANRLDKQNLNYEKPVDVFWLMNTKGKTTENLTMVEWKLAFGFKIVTILKGKKYKISLNAIEGRDIIIVQNKDGNVECFMNLNGKNCKLKSVFIEFEHTFYIPDVKYIDLNGNETINNKLVTERIYAD
jgi:hypothetical protein